MSGSFLRGAVVGLVCALLGGAAVALAGNGINGVFNLGVNNSVNAQTQLQGNTGTPQLLVNNQQGTDGAIGVQGLHSAADGAGAGVRGETASTGVNATGIFGRVSAAGSAGSSAGVRGVNAGPGTGVSGQSSGGYGVSGTGKFGLVGNGTDSGVWATTPNAAGSGVYGQNTTSGNGVFGKSTSGYGVRGDGKFGLVGFGSDSGVWATSANSSGSGVYGQNTTSGNGVFGKSTSGYGVRGDGKFGVVGFGSESGAWASTANATGSGVYGQNTTSCSFCAPGNGVLGESTHGYGVRGNGPIGVAGFGSDTGQGVYGTSTSGYGGLFVSDGGGYGVAGSASGGSQPIGVWGQSFSSSGFAGYFSGRVRIEGNLDVINGTKNFRIDDPLDPANTYLVHAAVESDQALDVYSGNITTDGRGLATVQLPAWFDKINTDFRYQLTIVGTRGWNARISQEIHNNQFTIETDMPNVKLSWQVTARRNDPYMQEHPFKAEQAKTGPERGRYATPQAYGRPASDRIDEIKPMPNPRASAAGLASG